MIVPDAQNNTGNQVVICNNATISAIIVATNHAIVPIEKTFRKSTCSGFGAAFRASGLTIGANFILPTIQLTEV